MKKLIIFALALVVAAAGCSKDPENSSPELEKRAFDSWVEMNRTEEWRQTALGSWITASTKGDESNPVGEKGFVRMEYTITDLKGNYTSYSTEDIAIQLGTWAKGAWYGPQVTFRTGNAYAGLNEILGSMCVGGTCRFVMPGWLATVKKYDTAQEYNDNVTGNSASIYDIKVVDAFDTVSVWEVDRIREVVGGDAALAQFDTLESGIFYRQIAASDNPDSTYTDGDDIYVKYVCKRALDGVKVDSNRNGILVNWKDDYTEMTITSNESTMIKGFARAVHEMKPHEKGEVYFISDYGYQSAGTSDKKIPGFCPLLFELEIVDKPNE